MDYPHHGRRRSWTAVAVVISGFAIGGAALIAGPVWWLFWIGVGIAAVGGLTSLFSNVMSDVILDAPRMITEEVYYTTLGKPEGQVRGGPHGETLRNPTSTDPATRPHG